jgi:hypothetical protein
VSRETGSDLPETVVWSSSQRDGDSVSLSPTDGGAAWLASVDPDQSRPETSLSFFIEPLDQRRQVRI